jgi:hypothetical protein
MAKHKHRFIFLAVLIVVLACTHFATSSVAQEDWRSLAVVSVVPDALDSGIAYQQYLPLLLRNAGPPAGAPLLTEIDNPDGGYQYTVGWSAVERATTYLLEEAQDPSFTSPITVYSGPDTSTALEVVAIGTYYYRVKATNAFAESAWSNDQFVLVTVPPPVLLTCEQHQFVSPDEIYVIYQNGLIWNFWAEHDMDVQALVVDSRLAWSGIVNQDEVTIEIQINDTLVATWTHELRFRFFMTHRHMQDLALELHAGDKISYFIFGGVYWGSPGLLTGPNSLTLCGQAFAIPATPLLGPIDNADGDGDYLVNWSASPGASSYTLQEDSDASFNHPTAVYSGTATSAAITEKPNGTYFYRVNAANSSGASAWSDSQSVVVSSSAAVIFTPHPIATNFDGAYSVYAADLDGDQDVDILGAAPEANLINWWENDGGQNFSEHQLASNYLQASSVFAADLDGDNDEDILGTAWESGEVTWWENLGNEGFSAHLVSDSYDGARSVYATDIDGDGDVDILAAASALNQVAWWRNDGSGSFEIFTIDSNFDSAVSVYAADLDGDGDVDVLGAANLGNEVTWWENDGGQNFSEHTIASDYEYAGSVFAVDLDADGDVDVLSGSSTSDGITWWENDGGQHFTPRTIQTGSMGLVVYASDLDGDGDMDVLAAGYAPGRIAWWQNDGSQNFAEHLIAGEFDGANALYPIDVDSDGDMDVIGAANVSDEIAWFEQR